MSRSLLRGPGQSGPPRRLGALAAALLLLPLPGCGGERGWRSKGGDAPQFEFRSLNLRQQDLLGRPTWQLASPQVRYDLRRRVAVLDGPRGVIFREGRPAYQLRAASGTMLNDGQVLLLEGGIRLEQLGRTPLLLRAVRARWYPSRNLLEIDRRPEALDGSNRLSSRRARFRFDTNHLVLQGQPRLEHWSRDFNPLRQDPPGSAELVLRVRQADWYPLRGELTARGPIEARRRPPGRAAALPPAVLTATALEGNTLQRRYRLRQPVRYSDPSEQARLSALDVDVDLRADVFSSASPFEASRGPLRVLGQSFQVFRSQSLVLIPAGCLVQRAGDSLQAEQCRLNWRSQEVFASGAGAPPFTRPGGRVVSRVLVPRRAAAPAPRPRPVPEPIRL